MCLTLVSRYKNKPTLQVYKTYSTGGQLDLGNPGKHIYSAFMAVAYCDVEEGTIIKSDRRLTRLTKEEINNEAIEKGIHSYLSYDQAKELLLTSTSSYPQLLIMLTGEKKDLVDVGFWENDGGHLASAVHRKLTVQKIIGYSSWNTRLNRAEFIKF